MSFVPRRRGAGGGYVFVLSDLQGISGDLDGYYVLGADIDATSTSGWNSGAGFNPIGTAFVSYTAGASTKVYDGTATLTGVSYTWSSGVDTGLIYGAAAYTAASASKDVGTYAINATGLSSDNYEIAYDDGTLVINPASADTSSWIIDAIESTLFGIKKGVNDTGHDLGFFGSDIQVVSLIGPEKGSLTLEGYRATDLVDQEQEDEE